jgi:hypothetical protein
MATQSRGSVITVTTMPLLYPMALNVMFTWQSHIAIGEEGSHNCAHQVQMHLSGNEITGSAM